MLFCDIHTHQTESAGDRLVIVNKSVDLNQAPCFLPGCYYSYGIHPWYITDVDRQMARLAEGLLDPAVVALGEAGLDKYAKQPMSRQVDVFERQASLSEELGKPLVIHCVKAWDELLAIKKSVNPRMPWVIHGFRGNRNLAGQLISKGFFLSFGALFNPEALAVAYPNSLLTETDESAVEIADVYQRIAADLSVSIEALSWVVRANVKSVFSI